MSANRNRRDMVVFQLDDEESEVSLMNRGADGIPLQPRASSSPTRTGFRNSGMEDIVFIDEPVSAGNQRFGKFQESGKVAVRRDLLWAAGILIVLLFLWIVIGFNFKTTHDAPFPVFNPSKIANDTRFHFKLTDYDRWKSMKTLSFDETVNYKLSPYMPSYSWVNAPESNSTLEGYYFDPTDSGKDGLFQKMIIRHAVTNEERTVLENMKFKRFQLSADGQYALISTVGYGKWRHGFLSNYFVVHLKTGKFVNLDPNQNYDISLVKWNPKSPSILYVKQNDVYIFVISNNRRFRVTNDGDSSGETIFNGVPDWVYEEEVLLKSDASWWSPDGKWLAFMKLDDQKVPLFDLTKYSVESAAAFPAIQRFRYPKPGTPNPIVSIFVLPMHELMEGEFDPSKAILYRADMKSFAEDSPDDLILYQAVFSAQSTHLLAVVTNRYQDKRRIIKFNLNGTSTTTNAVLPGEIIREDSRPHGWFEASDIIPLMKNNSEMYLDLVQNGDNEHIALFSMDSPNPVKFLTSGEWDVAIREWHYSAAIQRCFYFKTEANGIERYLESIDLDGNQKLRYLIDGKPGYYDASMSAGRQFFVLSYRGPDIPQQAAFDARNATSLRLLVSNQVFNETIKSYQLPKTEYTQLVLNSTMAFSGTINAKIVYPVGFDADKIAFYPLLVTTYGGPNSQSVAKQFEFDVGSYFASNWHASTTSPTLDLGLSKIADSKPILAKRDPSLNMTSMSKQDAMRRMMSQPPFIILTLDVRGTGLRGLKFRQAVTGRLGKLETDDIIQATYDFVQDRIYVDPDKVSFWGWSYGGYLTTKILSKNRASIIRTKSRGVTDIRVFSAGVAVAPVAHYKFYDSIYTERYMKAYDVHRADYEDTAAIPEDHQLQNTKLMILHGTGDDNVHVLNSMWLASRLQRFVLPTKDPFVKPSIYRLHFVPDDDHSMYNTLNAHELVYRLLVSWLVDAFTEIDHQRLMLSDTLMSTGNHVAGNDSLIKIASGRCLSQGILCG